jgi:hypothetical protein
MQVKSIQKWQDEYQGSVGGVVRQAEIGEIAGERSPSSAAFPADTHDLRGTDCAELWQSIWAAAAVYYDVSGHQKIEFAQNFLSTHSHTHTAATR